jgi:hypothetical protein
VNPEFDIFVRAAGNDRDFFDQLPCCGDGSGAIVVVSRAESGSQVLHLLAVAFRCIRMQLNRGRRLDVGQCRFDLVPLTARSS